MPEIVTVDAAKTFLRVEHADDDALIEGLILAATVVALDYADALELADGDAYPAPVRTAVLVYVGALYDRRENPVVPSAVLGLLQPFRTYGAG